LQNLSRQNTAADYLRVLEILLKREVQIGSAAAA
jgi:hypothetical protein